MRWLISLGLVAVLAGLSQAEVVVYPAPPEEKLSEDYRVSVGGQDVAVYTARTLDPPFAGKEWDYGGPYSFANFDADGAVEVKITSPKNLANTVIRPTCPDVAMRVVNEHEVIISLPGPRKISVEPEGKRGPLLLFVNSLERDPPKPNDPNVVYFGPGIHKPEKIVLGSQQTLYLAGGAVVKGGVLAQGDHIRITGRGILDSSDWEWRKGPTPTVISIRGSDVEVSGITVRGASHWTIVPVHSQRVTIRNVKICGGRVQNDDGINPCNSQDVLITDCFIRSDDDCVAMKGLDFVEGNNNVERVRVENCVLWCDRARIFLLGHESRAPFMRDITLTNLDIIHFSMTPFLLEPGEDMRLENVIVDNVRIHGEGQHELIRLRPVVNQYMRKKTPGFVSHITFKNVTVYGAPGQYRVQIHGADAEHNVKNVTFENVVILDEKLSKESSRLEIGNYVEAVNFE